MSAKTSRYFVYFQLSIMITLDNLALNYLYTCLWRCGKQCLGCELHHWSFSEKFNLKVGNLLLWGNSNAVLAARWWSLQYTEQALLKIIITNAEWNWKRFWKIWDIIDRIQIIWVDEITVFSCYFDVHCPHISSRICIVYYTTSASRNSRLTGLQAFFSSLQCILKDSVNFVNWISWDCGSNNNWVCIHKKKGGLTWLILS